MRKKGELLAKLPAPFQLVLALLQLILGRIDDQATQIPVKNGHISAGHLGSQAGDAHNGRYPEIPCHNGRMGSEAA